MRDDERPVAPAMRWVFLVGSVLVTAAAIQLFVLTDHTDRFFAWTIEPALSAAFLGAFYLTALVLAAGSALEQRWARARVGVFGVWLFVTLTLLATLLHLDRFHLSDPDPIARGAAWLWLVIYLIEPPAVLLAIVFQLRTPGRDGPRERELPGWYRGALAVEALIVTVVGFWLFAAPTSVAWWPWTVTPLVSRAIAAWLLGLAVVLWTGAWENEWSRIRIAAVAATVLGVLQLIAVLRYTGALRGGVSTPLYLAFLGSLVATGAVGLILPARAAA